MTVIDIRLAQMQKAYREEQKRIEEQTEEYFKELISHMNHSEVMELLEVIKNKDLEGYKRLTEPIIMRQAIIEFNR